MCKSGYVKLFGKLNRNATLLRESSQLESENLDDQHNGYTRKS